VSPDVAMDLAMDLATDLAIVQPACRQRAQALAANLAQADHCRRAVDWILSPPGVHFYKLHHRLWKKAPPNGK
jgi:hypothetical protein